MDNTMNNLQIDKAKLRKALKELKQKLNAQRKADNIAIADAFNSGFYCTGRRSNIKPLI